MIASRLTPTRRRGVEYLEVPGVDPGIVRRSLADVGVANKLFGGTRSVLAELRLAFSLSPQRSVTLLDVGSGLGDIPVAARVAAARAGIHLTTFLLDASETLVSASRAHDATALRGDARALPFASRSIDIVMCSQVLHHFEDRDAAQVLQEMDRVARQRVIVSDIRRSWLAAAGIWLASFPLRFHPVSRHDGVVSVMRGYTPDEMHALVRAAVAGDVSVRRRAGYRITAAWQPAGA